MTVTRRGFLAAFAAAGATAVLDPERLLWVPGRKVISISRVMPAPCEAQDIVERALRMIGALCPGEVPGCVCTDYALKSLSGIIAAGGTRVDFRDSSAVKGLVFSLAVEILPQFVVTARLGRAGIAG